MKQVILIHYHEINLKGQNRGWFETHLQKNVASLLKGLPLEKIERFVGRLLIELTQESPIDEIVRRLKMVFGAANIAVAWETLSEIEAIQLGLAELIPLRTFQSFKIDARRGTKEFPLNSQQINERLGGFVQDLTQAHVQLETPEAVFYIEIVKHRSFLYFDKLAGAGGLPSGTGGKVLCLISGGIDSPVAAFRMMRRGCRVFFVHFHSFPHTTLESQNKVRQILKTLSQYQLQSQLFLVPFADVQREIVAYAPPALRVVLYRRFMLCIAEAIALREKASALVTGDSLGQVASQTLENIRSISAGTNLPVFRPLIGDDKEDIIKIARAIDTYPISIQADQDCCSLFIPRHPETMSRMEQVKKAENLLDVPRLVQSALESTVHETVYPEFHIKSQTVAQ